MRFFAPHWLWLLALLAAVVVAYVVLQGRRRQYAVRFTNLELLDVVAPQRPGWRRHVPAVLFALALASLVVALARPTRAEQVARERATIVLAIDTSLSMQADDVDPTRLEAAQDAATDFAEQLPEGLNLGLVTFNGVATIAVAPTTERESVVDAIDELELGESTAIGEAIYASLDAVEMAPEAGSDDPPPARIVLMSDGETTVGRPDALGATEADDQNVPVSTIAYGTDEGVIEIEQEPLPVPVPVNEIALEDIAGITGGEFFTAATADELQSVYDDIGSEVGSEEERREVTTWFLGAGVALMIVAAGLSLAWFTRLP